MEMKRSAVKGNSRNERSIAILSRWNATCGVSLHAELIGQEFLNLGYNLKIFAPKIESASRWWHHRIVREDDGFFVKRCFEERDLNLSDGNLDEEVILSEDFDFLIVESYISLPYADIEKILPEVKKKAKVVAVIHEGSRADIEYSLEKFDKVIVFDERYKKMLGKIENVEIIPYPCHPIVEGRRKFGEDGLKFFTFGRQPSQEYEDYFRVLDKLCERYIFTYHIIRSDGFIAFKRPWLIQERKRVYDVYPYLHAADIHLIPKGNAKRVVVSSTFYQCLGALTPVVVPNTRHFETLPEINGVKPAVVYQDVEDLEEKIVRLIEDEKFREQVVSAARVYVERNRSDRVAKRFIEVLNSI